MMSRIMFYNVNKYISTFWVVCWYSFEIQQTIDIIVRFNIDKNPKENSLKAYG